MHLKENIPVLLQLMSQCYLQHFNKILAILQNMFYQQKVAYKETNKIILTEGILCIKTLLETNKKVILCYLSKCRILRPILEQAAASMLSGSPEKQTQIHNFFTITYSYTFCIFDRSIFRSILFFLVFNYASVFFFIVVLLQSPCNNF